MGGIAQGSQDLRGPGTGLGVHQAGGGGVGVFVHIHPGKQIVEILRGHQEPGAAAEPGGILPAGGPQLVDGVEGLALDAGDGLSRTGYFRDVSFSVRKGEIVGLTGLVGAGRTEVIQTIFGIAKKNKGKIFLEGKEVHIHRPADAMELGIGLLPEDRQLQGLILDWGIGSNITLPELRKYAKKGVFTQDKVSNQVAKELAERVDTKAVSVFDKASSLSGGNQQKVVVAKILASNLKVLIMDEPTKGVDVGAKAAIYEIMGDLAQQGYAIVMISSEMPEILGMCDRVFVMCDGRVTGELDRKEASQELILELAMSKSRAGQTA